MTEKPPQSSDDWSDDDELTEPNIGELPSDPGARLAQVTLLLFKLGQRSGHPADIERAYALGYRAAVLAQKDEQRRLAGLSPSPKQCPGGDHPFQHVDGGHCGVCGYGHK
jgi:hypothetical protein